jgi:hypothetical protein
MKTKWTTLMLASAALALLMAVTSRVSADDRQMAPTASSPFCGTNPLTLDEPGGLPASAERCAADTGSPDSTDQLASDGDVHRTASLEGCDCRKPACNPYCMTVPNLGIRTATPFHDTASLEGCDCRRPACNPYCMVGAATSHDDHFEIGFDAAP